MEINLNYSDWKENVISKNLDHLSYIKNGSYVLIAVDYKIYYTCDLDTDDVADYESQMLPSANKKLSNVTPVQSAIPVAIYKPETSGFARATHDFCNKTTWWQNSVEVIGETPTLLSVVNFTYQLSNTNIIDCYSGAINRQDLLQETHGHKVYVNGAEVTNYTIDYKQGIINFETLPVGTITVDYHYATNSKWKLEPKEDKVLIIEHSELQFASDVGINTPLKFEIFVNNPFFGSPGHPWEFLEKIPYETVQYNSMRDFINESNLGAGVIPQVADLPTDIHVFPFNYTTVKPLAFSQGTELIISCVDDVELDGSFGTATFYLLNKDEE